MENESEVREEVIKEVVDYLEGAFWMFAGMDEPIDEQDYQRLRRTRWTYSGLVEFLTRVERRKGLAVEMFGLLALAKAALRSENDRKRLFVEAARIHGLWDEDEDGVAFPGGGSG